MSRRVMYNYLELSYSPVSNHIFTIIKEDPLFQQLTQKSTLYVIAQRGELVLDNLDFLPLEDGQLICRFEIRQKGHKSVLKCKLPVYQDALAADLTRDLKFHLEYAMPKPVPPPQTFPQFNIVNLLFTYHDDTFIGWISPENFLQNYLNGVIEAEVSGPVEDFLRYKVHYVGKATEQNVWTRLTGHATLQQILSLEYPLHFGTLPTHEIAILFFQFRDAYKLHTISASEPISDEVVDSLLSRNQPTSRVISLDAEKALISAMQPKYNKEFYRSYPKSKDGLYPFKLDAYSFRIHSHIILEYQSGVIKGAPHLLQSDAIVVQKGKPLKVIKYFTSPSSPEEDHLPNS